MATRVAVISSSSHCGPKRARRNALRADKPAGHKRTRRSGLGGCTDQRVRPFSIVELGPHVKSSPQRHTAATPRLTPLPHRMPVPLPIDSAGSHRCHYPQRRSNSGFIGVAPTASTADICRISGIKRTTLAQQLVRGKVAETTLVSISRALDLSPLADLASFDSYAELAAPPQPPTPAELVSQVATMDLLRAVISRSSPAYGGFGDHGSSMTPALSPAPHATSVRNWVDAIDDGELRHRVSAATGVAPQNYSAQLTANRLSPELAVATARAAGVGFTGGLVATGLITEDEAGWTPGRSKPRWTPSPTANSAPWPGSGFRPSENRCGARSRSRHKQKRFGRTSDDRDPAVDHAGGVRHRHARPRAQCRSGVRTGPCSASSRS